MNRTKIEWVKNPDGTQGYTWNPITGCLNNCLYCWARGLANGRLKSRMLANTNLVSHSSQPVVDHGGHHADPFYPRLWRSRLHQLGNPMDRSTWHRTVKGIFVCSMSDLFGVGVPDEWTAEVFAVMADTPHRYYLLTKQAQNLAKWSPFPDNCWVGVSATDAMMAYDAMAALAKVEAKVKYISFEPLLERINGGECEGRRLEGLAEAGINWLIVGAQSKPSVMPKPWWVQEIMAEAHNAGDIPVFLKDSLRPLLTTGAWAGWNFRQEMPK